MARLVNKQFNSPIGLYSQQNIQEVLDRDTQILANGAVGIDFRNPGVGKPGNLKNSAVLRMLEEEENRQRNGFAPGTKVVTWPPPNESDIDNPYNEQGVQCQDGPQYQQSNYSTLPAGQAQKRAPLKPLDVSSPGVGSPLASPSLNQSPLGYRSPTPAKGWAPVHSPSQAQHQKPSWRQQPPFQQTYPGQQYQQTVVQQYQQQQPQGQSYQTTTQQYQYSQQYQTSSQQQQYQSPQLVQSANVYSPSKQQSQSQYTPTSPNPSAAAYQGRTPAKHVEPPPATIPLRPQAPVSQAPPPVYNSQPATATLKGGKHLRGDMKWPPENVKQQAEEENRLRIELARGPVCRPRRPNKDYRPFFEQHALNNTYPGYKIPPGTQFYRPE